MATPALGTGIETEQLLPVQIRDVLVTGALLLLRYAWQALRRERVPEQQRRAGREDVLDLGGRDQRDEAESKYTVEPPQDSAQHSGARDRQPGGAHEHGEGGANRRPPAQVPDHRARLEPDQARAFEHKARDRDQQQCPQGHPVFDPIGTAVEISIAWDAIRARIVQLWRFEPASAVHHVEEAGGQHDARDVQNEREPEIEVPIPEAHAQ